MTKGDGNSGDETEGPSGNPSMNFVPVVGGKVPPLFVAPASAPISAILNGAVWASALPISARIMNATNTLRAIVSLLGQVESEPRIGMTDHSAYQSAPTSYWSLVGLRE